MRTFRGTSASFTTVISLGVLYVTVVVLTVLLSREVLRSREGYQLQFGILFAALGLLFVLVLLVIVGINVTRLLKERRRGVPGSTLKSRMSLVFALVVMLAAIPQGVVSVTFLSSALELLFSTGTATALSQGLQLSLQIYDQQVEEMERIAADETLQNLLSDATGASGLGEEELFLRLSRRLPLLAAIQIVDYTGGEILFTGAEHLRRTEPPPRLTANQPVISRFSIEGEGYIRLVQRPGPPEEPVVMITTRLPEGFEAAARNITQARGTFDRLEQLRPVFVLYVGLVYGVFAAPILLMAVLASFFLSDRIMRPIESLEEATRRVAEGDYSVRILGRPNDDLGLLVISFNNMVTDLDRARRRMAQAEKVQAWQEIAQRLAHEIKNPLTPIRLAAERLRRRYEAEAPDFGDVLERTVETIVREVDALSSLLNDFRSFARMPRPSRESVRVLDLVREAAAVYREDPRITIDTEGIDPELQVPLDRNQMRQVIMNLIANASEAAGEKVSIGFRADVVRKNNDSYCRLRVEDDGPGIPSDLGRGVFDPYVTSKRDGTGLGLAIVQRIVYDHDGQISFETAPGSGTTFTIDLPVELEGSADV
ncbi:MAG: HAMP domain-containing protein [Spirochaetaceae bacterium]|nr:MAG: HAMP domain-containing protein [Spirochaetaceae bacterium]